ncbi:MAG: dihydroneopterin aldolase [Alphaproteobacteria bacterium]|nr:dihydroneopterin aldolase [Alphaproteobacteria bacterium]
MTLPAAASRRIFIRDLVLEVLIGVHRHERRQRQPVRINIDLVVDGGVSEDRLEQVVDYESVVADVRDLVTRGHINLVETLAERIAGYCLTDPRVEEARIRVEKLAVLPDAASVGVELVRRRA